MHKASGFLLVIFLISGFPSLSQTMDTLGFQKPDSLRLDSLPVSEIDIPIQVALQPFYALAEKGVDTTFTSPGYPEGWIQSDCATRYKYHFRRTPLRIVASGNTFHLGFTGLYQIQGSTRACVGSTVISPWTPACGCGFTEGRRKVTIGFTGNFSLRPDYILNTRIIRHEPKALDKCTVCFWGQDITNTVMEGLKKELDASKKLMEDSFSTIDLKPYIQQAWNQLNTPFAIPGAGYFSLNPKQLRMENIMAKNEFLNINIGISATPIISFVKPDTVVSVVPNLGPAVNREGFNIHLEAALQYDSLSSVMNSYLVNKRFELTEGIIRKHMIVQRTVVSGDTSGHLIIRIDFTGSHNGTVYLTGKPSYNSDTKTIEVRDLDYDLQSRDFLLRTAQWLFNKRIIGELKKYTSFNLAGYYDTATTAINTWLNKEWTKGIQGAGSVSELKLTSLQALPQHLMIRSNCTGKLRVLVTEIDLQF